MKLTHSAIKMTMISATFVLAGCTANAPRHQVDLSKSYHKEQPEAHELIAEQSRSAWERMQKLRASLETQALDEATQSIVEVPEFNPLDEVKVTLSVENAALHQVLKVFAGQTGLNLLVHPNLLNADYLISMEFKDVSASMVFDQIMRIADVSGAIENNTIIVNPMEDAVFNLAFMESDVESTFATGGDVLGGSSNGGQNGGSGGSGNNQIKGEFSISGVAMPNSNPYDALENMLQKLVGSNSSDILAGTIAGASTMAEVGKLSRLGSAVRNDLAMYSLNRTTGTLFVRAKPSVMKTVKTLVNNYEQVHSGQLLIEAQIIEVNLSDDFRWGVDWSILRDDIASAFSAGTRSVSEAVGTFGNLSQGARGITLTTPPMGGSGTSDFSFHKSTGSTLVAIDMMQKYGDVGVLSNPTIRAKHGQPAIISVGTSSTYISDTRITTNGTGTGLSTTQEVQTRQVFDGLMVGVVPFIAKNGDINLSIHPVQSKVNPLSLGLVEAGADVKVTLPEVELKSMSTQLQVKNGNTIIMGGLIDQSDFRNESEVPVLGSLPVLGNLFKKKSNGTGVRELVLVLKVNLI
ncbi:pilus (MSHA type) biogenesis protein MshL [Pseudoalteromonas sp. PS5]|uniref:pilus (MSHA type) biogenesis protein MshL n=1 Tax=Pseudoalteromonas sp. PS5 TaxID=1437473 RepID=UPI000FFED0A7|nr:pilus (MSHA type) biogenesis protein MshL [Pseudoalteromonas sp. PS5]RXF00626.1 pilus (MSHA type) biogenesis protein MshL [Pseudoalteromonas sp. PS5]